MAPSANATGSDRAEWKASITPDWSTRVRLMIVFEVSKYALPGSPRSRFIVGSRQKQIKSERPDNVGLGQGVPPLPALLAPLPSLLGGGFHLKTPILR